MVRLSWSWSRSCCISRCTVHTFVPFVSLTIDYSDSGCANDSSFPISLTILNRTPDLRTVGQLLMEDRKEKTAPWLSVPQFGDWDQQGTLPDYSMDFSKIRENRKQNKRDLSRASLGNEEEFNTSTTASINSSLRDHQQPLGHHSPTTRKSILRYFNCCAKA